MKDLKFEQKRSMSRLEAADQLAALAEALRQGGEVDMEFGLGTLSLQIPDDLRGEVEVEIGNGEVELEIEFTWPTAARRAPSPGAADTEKADTEKRTVRKRKSAPAGAGRRSAGTARSGTGTTSGKRAEPPAPKKS
ncbi:amphi-Trp domain-containing protein [Streptomyces sp. NPDC058664]|uniref:amphi-Trp domain-containing protein n=1 Tax=unclassified Streptomyces TaxID=2593676 RepID=UPI0036563EDC